MISQSFLLYYILSNMKENKIRFLCDPVSIQTYVACVSLQVLPMEAADGGADTDGMVGFLRMAPVSLPSLLLHLPAGLQLCPHL